MALHGVLVTAKLCEPTCMTEMNGICEQWYDATVGPPCRPAAALTLGMFATWLSTIVAVLVILVKSLLGRRPSAPEHSRRRNAMKSILSPEQ